MSNPVKVVINEDSDTLSAFLKKIWQHRSLIVTLAKRDLKIKYAQTYLGAAWTILQPVTGLLIFTFFFNNVIKIDVPGGDYALFAFSGMTSWYFFSYIIYQSGNSLIQGQELMKKVYFPKLILPLSKVLVGFVDFGLSFIVLLILMMIKGILPGWQIIFLPLFIVLNVIVGLSISLWMTTLSIQYRDLQHILPYLVNFGIWLTPVFYPSTILPANTAYLLKYNPMAGIIEGFRYCLLPGYTFDMGYFIGIGISLVVFVLAILFFKRVEDRIIHLI